MRGACLDDVWHTVERGPRPTAAPQLPSRRAAAVRACMQDSTACARTVGARMCGGRRTLVSDFVGLGIIAGKGLKLYDVYSEAVKKLFRSGCHGGKDCGPTKVVYRHACQCLRTRVPMRALLSRRVYGLLPPSPMPHAVGNADRHRRCRCRA